MTIDRRSLLTSLAAGATLLPFTAGAASRAAANSGTAAAPPRAGLRRADGSVDWPAVRAQFDGLAPDWTHLSSFLFVSHTRALREEIERLRRFLDTDPYAIEELLFAPGEHNAYQVARRAVAGYLGGRPEDLAFTGNTTTALALAYHGLKIRSDQEILTSEHDHFAHHESIRYSAARSGAAVRYIALHDSPATATAADIVQRVERALRPQTRILGLTWVHSASGLKLPIAAISEIVARANRGRSGADRCLFVVDGVHGFGNQDVDVPSLGADFFAAGLHKWFFGPRGTGFLWGREAGWRETRPVVPSFDPMAEAAFVAWMDRRELPPMEASFMSPGGFLAYEHLMALPVAADLHRELGRPAIAARIVELNSALRDGIARTPGVTLVTPRDPSLAAGINCFKVAGKSSAEVAARMAERRVRATSSPYAKPLARLAAGIMNDERDLERAFTALREVARA